MGQATPNPTGGGVQGISAKDVTMPRAQIMPNFFEGLRCDSDFFYITNRVDYTGEQIVSLANARCNQENVIEQLKNGVNAMRMAVDDLLSNWAYMVMTSLAWNLKAWFGLLLPNGQRGLELIKMEFRRFCTQSFYYPRRSCARADGSSTAS